MDLQSIAVNGQMLPIDPSVFATSDNQGTIVDTGTTLTYLVVDAFEPFVNAVSFSFSFGFLPFLLWWSNESFVSFFYFAYNLLNRSIEKGQIVI